VHHAHPGSAQTRHCSCHHRPGSQLWVSTYLALDEQTVIATHKGTAVGALNLVGQFTVLVETLLSTGRSVQSAQRVQRVITVSLSPAMLWETVLPDFQVGSLVPRPELETGLDRPAQALVGSMQVRVVCCRHVPCFRAPFVSLQPLHIQWLSSLSGRSIQSGTTTGFPSLCRAAWALWRIKHQFIKPRYCQS
jgi:hypothetical protein